MKKATLIILAISLGLMGWKMKGENNAEGRKKTSLAAELVMNEGDSTKTDQVSIKVKASAYTVARIQLLSIETLEGEVLMEKLVADNVSSTLKLNVKPGTSSLVVKYDNMVKEIFVKDGKGEFDFRNEAK